MHRPGIVILILALVLILGCSNDPTREIIGTWGGSVIRQDLTFFSDGRVEMKGHAHGTYYGEYRITAKDQLRCDFPKLSRPVERTVRIRGDKLFLIDAKGNKEKYTRK